MICYGFKLFKDEDGDIVPSDIYEVSISEKIEDSLDGESVLAVAYSGDKEIWFYARDDTNLICYLKGMNFMVTQVYSKPWDKLFEASHPELLL